MADITTEQISERTGFEVVPEVVEETPAEVEETPKVEEPITEEEPKAKELPEEIEEPSEEEEEPEEPKVEPKPEERQQRTVPYGKLKSEIQKRKGLESDIQGIKSDIKELGSTISELLKGNKKEIDSDPIRVAAKELAEKKGYDEDFVAELLAKAKELSSSALPKDVSEKLKELETITAEGKKKQQELEDAKNFNGEWDNFIPELKKQYPNANDSMLKEAREKMDSLAHSPIHHTHEMDYILWKEKQVFDLLLKVAPKSKGGERGKQILVNEEDEDDDNTNIENLTPAIMKARENKRIERNDIDRNGDITFLKNNIQ
jgi:hypothetical protein